MISYNNKEEFTEFLQKHDRFSQDRLPHLVEWNPMAISEDKFDWIQEHCQGQYGIHNEPSYDFQFTGGRFVSVERIRIYITFELEKDAVLFKLKFGNGENDDES